MLDMGFLPDIRRVLKHLPPARQTLFFSATMPPPIVDAGARDAAQPGDHQRRAPVARPAVGITQAVYPVPQRAEVAAAARAAAARRHQERARLHADQAPRQPAGRLPGAPRRARATASTATAARRSAPQALAGFKAGRVPGAGGHRHRRARHRRGGAVATSSTSTCRTSPEDYIHRVGRTARAESEGDAFTFVSPEEEGEPARHRAGDRQAAAARDACRVRLHEAPGREARSAAGPAPGGAPRAAGAEAQAGARFGRAQARGSGTRTGTGTGRSRREPAAPKRAQPGRPRPPRGWALVLGYRGSSATIRTGPPEPPAIFIGSAITQAPVAGSSSRLARFSRPGTFGRRGDLVDDEVLRGAVIDAGGVHAQRPHLALLDQAAARPRVPYDGKWRFEASPGLSSPR